MAANYWDSTQAKFWTFTKAELANIRSDLEKSHQSLHNRHVLPDRRLMNIYFQQQLLKLGRRMQLRQQPLATAQIYLKRYWLRAEIRKTNPYLIMTTAVYLACKMEECPQHIRLMLGEAARQWPELGVTESSKIGECEFVIISTLHSRLICHHPYRSLSEFVQTFGLSNEESQLAHSVVNDIYLTDLPLLHAPHTLAIVAIMIALVFRPSGQPAGLQAHSAMGSSSQNAMSMGSPTSLSGSGFSPAISASAAQQILGNFGGLRQAGPKLSKLVEWLAESQVDVPALIDATQELVSLYSIWEEGYNERACKEAITKFIRENIVDRTLFMFEPRPSKDELALEFRKGHLLAKTLQMPPATASAGAAWSRVKTQSKVKCDTSAAKMPAPAKPSPAAPSKTKSKRARADSLMSGQSTRSKTGRASGSSSSLSSPPSDPLSLSSPPSDPSPPERVTRPKKSLPSYPQSQPSPVKKLTLKIRTNHLSKSQEEPERQNEIKRTPVKLSGVSDPGLTNFPDKEGAYDQRTHAFGPKQGRPASSSLKDKTIPPSPMAEASPQPQAKRGKLEEDDDAEVDEGGLDKNGRGRKSSRTDDSSRPFVCRVCNQRFRRQEHLKRHFNTRHTDNKPFKCLTCGKTFSRNDNLLQHQRTHGGDKPDAVYAAEVVDDDAPRPVLQRKVKQKKASPKYTEDDEEDDEEDEEEVVQASPPRSARKRKTSQTTAPPPPVMGLVLNLFDAVAGEED